MWLVLSSPSPSPPPPCLNPNSTLKDRVSFLPLLYFPCSFPSKKYSLNLGRMRLSTHLKTMDTCAFFSSPSTSTGATPRAAEDKVNDNALLQQLHSRTFLNAKSGEELLSGIKKERESGRLSANLASGMEELYQNYRNAVQLSGVPNAEEIILSNMSAVLDRILLDIEDPFEFPPHHEAIREPFDYFMFGLNYIRPLIDFRNSYVGNVSLFQEMEQKLRLGHNVVLMSNHQGEPDPAVISLLLEKTSPYISDNMICVAGDRVITDPLCKPFSMGRNLLCVYSKKHMHDVPELVDMKRKANTRSLKEMALLLRRGSQLIWIAPSGGRDRPDRMTKEWFPAPFDVPSVDNMRRLVEYAGVPGHIYPLALLCYDIMPPPPQVEKEIGEKRVISFHGTGLSAGPEINYSDVTFGCESEEEAKVAYSMALYNSVNEQYKALKAAVHGKQGVNASNSSSILSQPWS